MVRRGLQWTRISTNRFALPSRCRRSGKGGWIHGAPEIHSPDRPEIYFVRLRCRRIGVCARVDCPGAARGRRRAFRRRRTLWRRRGPRKRASSAPFFGAARSDARARSVSRRDALHFRAALTYRGAPAAESAKLREPCDDHSAAGCKCASTHRDWFSAGDWWGAHSLDAGSAAKFRGVELLRRRARDLAESGRRNSGGRISSRISYFADLSAAADLSD